MCATAKTIDSCTNDVPMCLVQPVCSSYPTTTQQHGRQPQQPRLVWRAMSTYRQVTAKVTSWGPYTESWGLVWRAVSTYRQVTAKVTSWGPYVRALVSGKNNCVCYTHSPPHWFLASSTPTISVVTDNHELCGKTHHNCNKHDVCNYMNVCNSEDD